MSKRNKFITAISSLGTIGFSLSEFRCSTIFDKFLSNHPKFKPLYDIVAEITRDSTVFWFALGFSVIAIVLNVVVPYSCKKPLKEYLDDIYDSNFAGALGDVRVTIFKISYGICLWPKFIISNIKLFICHKQRGVLKHHFKSFPWKFWKEYASFYVRRGKPLESGTLAIFNIANKNEEINGVVSKSLFMEQPIAVCLPDIANINLSTHKSETTLNRMQRKSIDEYKKKGFIKSFDQLKAMHFFPTYILAMPILGQNEKQWGCLVVDAKDSQSLIENDMIRKKMEDSSIAISSIIKAVN